MTIEHLDDLPLIGSQIRQIKLTELINVHFPDHGHWKGINGGQVVFGWLLYILSESDHRLSHVEEWSALRLNTIAAILGESELRKIDFCDDRLARLLDRFSDDEKWNEFEKSLSKKMLQVYKLNGGKDDVKIIRSDSCNAPQYREPSELFRYGFSKQRRADQPFCKVMMSSLDPLTVPLSVSIIKGSGPDVDHYLPIINKVQEMLEERGNLYVGDSQLGSLPNRLAIHLAGDYYLCPLSKKQVSREELNKYIARLDVPIKELPSIFTSPESKRKPAYFFELKEQITDDVTQETWSERRILVHSPNYADSLIKVLVKRLEKAEEQIKNLVVSKRGRRNPKTLQDLHARIGAIIKKFKVENCFEINCTEKIEQTRVQKHKNRPEETREKVILDLTITKNEKIIAQKKEELSWQIYGTNVPEDKLETAHLVRAYRDEYKIEHLFDLLINRDVGLLPIYLKKEERVKGLIRLLSIALRFSRIIQHKVRTGLAKSGKEISGIYPGNKGRKTTTPTTQMLFRAFNGIAVVWITTGDDCKVQMTGLNDTQKIIIKLLGVPDEYNQVLKVFESGSVLREM